MVTNQASSSSGGDGGGIKNMMKQLGIGEEDLDDVIFEEEEQPPPETTKWLAIARVLNDSDYSSFCSSKTCTLHGILLRTSRPDLSRAICILSSFNASEIGNA
jgi:hypothetical protein